MFLSLLILLLLWPRSTHIFAPNGKNCLDTVLFWQIHSCFKNWLIKTHGPHGQSNKISGI